MDRRERYQDLSQLLLAAFQSGQQALWTSLPCIVQSYNPDTNTIEAQPTILGRVQDQQGLWSLKQMPLLLDVPVIFPSGGGYTLTFPIAAGDECLVVFSSRCIDGWWYQGGIQPQLDVRMHDLSDGFAFVGPMSRPNVIPTISTSTTQLRSNDGSIYVELSPAQIKLHHPTKVLIDAPNSEVTGNLTVDGLLTFLNGIAGDKGTNSNSLTGGVSTTGTLTNNGSNVGSTHIHSDPQGGNVGPPF